MKTPVRIQLVTLPNGQRLLRLEDCVTGLTLERKFNPGQPLIAQRAKLLQLFESIVESEVIAA